MLLGKVLNSSASLNSFEEISSLEFIPGEEVRLVMRLIQGQRSDQLRYIPDTAATVTVMLPKKDGTTEDLVMTKFTDDRSIWYVDLQKSVTSELANGNFTFEVDELGDATKITKGWVQNGLSLIIIDGGIC